MKKRSSKAHCVGCGTTLGDLGTVRVSVGGKRLLLHSCYRCWPRVVVAVDELVADIKAGRVS